MRRLLVLVLLFLPLGWAVGWAETLVVYPLDSQDVLLGVAVADRVAQAFDAVLETVGPDVAPSLVPPVAVGDGFVNLTDFLGQDALASARGVRLLQEVLGADNVVTGTLSFEEDRVTARVFYLHEGVARTFAVSAPAAEPSLLVRKTVTVLAARLGVALPETDLGVDLSGPYGDYVRAVALVGAGFVEEAGTVLEEAGSEPNSEDPEDPDAAAPDTAPDTAAQNTATSNAEADLEARIQALLQDIDAARVGAEVTGAEVDAKVNGAARAGRLATLSLGVAPLDEAISIRYFQAFAEQTELPVAQTWLATLYASDRQDALAAAAFDAVADTVADTVADAGGTEPAYGFGRAARAAFQASRGLAAEDLTSLVQADSFASLLTAGLVAQDGGDLEQEKAALTRLTRLAPDFVYPFERLSFIAFDEEEPLAAAQALAVATRLEPDNDLYWTNLGWSYYLLGLLAQSEAASTRALTLAPDQYIALYNLGLAQVVQGRVEEALDAYDEALALDPEVDDAAVEDLENALRLYPRQPGIYYPLARLYEQEGRREDAAKALERFLDGNPGGPDAATDAAYTDAAYIDAAQARLEVLRAPLPPLEISDSARVGLGPTGIAAAPFHPGDRVYPSFELYTSGVELPNRVSVNVALKKGDTVVAEQSRDIDVPTNAIGYVVDSLGLDLPVDLAAGTYTVTLSATASEDRSAAAEVVFEVSGQPDLLRRLLGQNITMLALESETALYTRGDLNEGDDVLLATLLAELRANADAADAALPELDTGRFAGFGGGELFLGSTTQDVRDFLNYFLAQGGGDATFSFVDAYAQWALSGAPTE